MSTKPPTKVQSPTPFFILPILFVTIYVLALTAGLAVLAATLLAPYTSLAPIQVAGIFFFAFLGFIGASIKMRQIEMRK